jgi:hypothetical protein
MQDNAPAHSAMKVLRFLQHRDVRLGEIMWDYSHDLAPADFFIFPKLKSPLKEDFTGWPCVLDGRLTSCVLQVRPI